MTRQQTKFMPGQRVGAWKLIEYRSGQWERDGMRFRRIRKPEWKCECSCGAIRWVRAERLRTGGSTSCGHSQAQLQRHAAGNLRPVNSVFALGGAA